MKQIFENNRNMLLQRRAIGHSFIHIQNSPYANNFIGGIKYNINDNITCWIIKARTNMLVNGNLCNKFNIRIPGRVICCPYCGERANDTINHRLNSCAHNQVQKKKRHNMVQSIIVKELKKIFLEANITIDHGVNIDGVQVEEPFNNLRPDIVAYDDNIINIVEITCPYDMIKDNNEETMTIAYNTKVNKYKDLINKCNEQFRRDTKLTIIVVSSLGAIYNKSIKQVKKLLRIRDNNTKMLNNILRRMSTVSCIGSYFIYYNLHFSENMRDNDIDIQNENENDNNYANNTIEDTNNNSTSTSEDEENMYMNVNNNEPILYDPNNDTSDDETRTADVSQNIEN